MGNSATHWRDFPIHHEPDLLKLNLQLHRSDTYRWHRNEVISLGEGTWDPDAEYVELSASAEAQVRGVDLITFRRLDDKDVINEPTLTAFQIALQGSETSMLLPEERFVVFRDGNSHSSGKRMFGLTSSRKRERIGTTFAIESSWGGSLHPGEAFSVAIPKASEPQPVEFILPFPSVAK